MADMLELFWSSARMQNGDEYQPDTLGRLKAALRRWLMNHDWHGRESTTVVDINTHPAFTNAEKSLTAKIKSLREAGGGFKPNKADKLDRSDIEALWQERILGDHEPAPLERALWILLQLQYCFRGNQEALKLRWKNLVDVPATDQEPRMLIYKEHFITKNNKEVIKIQCSSSDSLF